MLRLAAILVLVSAPAAFLWPGRPAAGLSLDDVREAIDGTKTVCFNVEQVAIERGIPQAEPFHTRILIQSPFLIRMQMGVRYEVIDTDAQRYIGVNPAEKRVTIVENFKEGRDQMPGDLGVYFRDMIRGLADREAEPLGTRRIDGREAVGFRVDGPLPPLIDNPPPFPTTSDIWVDRETQLPLQIVMTITQDEDVQIATMTDFEFDRELDPALFSFEIPEGFEVRRLGVPELKPAPPEEEVAAPNPDEPTGQVSLTYPDRGLTFTLQDDELYNIIAQPMQEAELRDE